MQLRQVAQQNTHLVTEALCDIGVDPLPFTSESLDFVIGGDGRIYPIVTLKQGNNELSIEFNEGFDPALLRRYSSTIRGSLRSAEVHFLQEDPTGSDINVVVTSGGNYVEQVVVTERLRVYFDFSFEDASSDGECEEKDDF